MHEVFMKRKVELDRAAIRRIVETFGNLYEEAGIPLQKDIAFVLSYYFDTTPENGLKLASRRYEKFLQNEEINWKLK